MAITESEIEEVATELAARDLAFVKVVCACDESKPWRCGSMENVSRWPGEMFEMPAAEKLLAMCPDCANIRNVGICPFDVTEETYALRFELGEIILAADDAAEGSMRQFSDRLERAVGLDPDRLASCVECGEAMYRDDLTSGPECPEIGWEYYECSSCETTYHPRQVEGSR